jgi:hypothetical protein
MKNRTAEVETIQYADKFIRQARKQAKEFANGKSTMEVDVVYSWYIMAVYAVIAEDSLSRAVLYSSLFSCSLSELKRSKTLSDNELSWLETLWQGIVSSLYYVHRDLLFQETGPTEWATSFEPLQQLLEKSSSLIPSEIDIAALPRSMTSEVVCQKVITLSIYMQFYLDQFLFRTTYDAGAAAAGVTEFLRARLQSILARIIDLVAHVSNIPDYIHHAYSFSADVEADSEFDGPANAFLNYPDLQRRGLKSGAEPTARDTALALLYTFAQLAKHMLQSTSDVEAEDDAIRHSAIAICRLCASFGSFDTPMVHLLAKRSLFWAGLILTESEYPHGRFVVWNC